MNVGMLWFDNDIKSEIKTKIKRAAVYYQKKYGQVPNLCYVHPSMVGGESFRADGIEIRTTKSVLPHHFWIGVYDEPPLVDAGVRNGLAKSSQGESAGIPAAN